MAALALLLGLFLALLFSWVFDDVESDLDLSASAAPTPTTDAPQKK